MKRICIFGASITWGAFDKKGGGWIHRLNSNFINKKTDIQIYNLGVPGNNTNDLLKRFDNECSARKPDLIIFGLGGNDASYIDTENNMVVSIDQFKNNILKLIQQGKYFTDKILFLGLTKVNESKTMPSSRNKRKFLSNKNIAKYDLIINTTCYEMEILFLPMIDLLDIDDLSNDGRHPNDNGYQKISNCVRDYLYKNNLI
jgi:lysophospholipase L1-like esterase